MKRALKNVAVGIWIVFLWPCAFQTAFGRLKPIYTIFAHTVALVPGILGDYARAAYYYMTLRRCSAETRIMFGTIFAHPEATVGSHVSIGPYCVIGQAHIGERTQIGAHVQILSGSEQPTRDEQGHLLPGPLADIEIGADCWIGASAVLLAPVGAGATVGAGSVVVHPVSPGDTVVGNPARVVRSAGDAVAIKP